MDINRHIVVAAVGITGIGAVNAVLAHKPVSPVLLGGYALLVVLSIVDVFGGGASMVASGIAMVALFTMILTQFPWEALSQLPYAKVNAVLGGAQAGLTGGH